MEEALFNHHMHFNKKEIKLFIYSICFAILTSFLLYNIRVILDYIANTKISPFKFQNEAKYISYLLFAFVASKKYESFKKLICIILLPVFVIDSTTLIYGRELIPIRFPYATIFPILGTISGITLRYKPNRFWHTFIISIIFIILSNKFIIPLLQWQIHKENYVKNINNESIINDKYLGSDGNYYKILDTLKNNPAIIEFYFVGCTPCEEKYEYLKLLKEKIGYENLNIVLICDGSITNKKTFLKHFSQNKFKNIIFLYDNNQLIKKYKIEGYPTEILYDGKKIIKREIGFGKSIAMRWLKNEQALINNIFKNDR